MVNQNEQAAFIGLNPDDPLNSVKAIFQHLTGREPTPEELEEARKEYEKNAKG